ncbi:hypothetical protein J3Q64DRAFT_1693608 [Phycomyces blakesleeanus]|uniref:Uncharacterized protein n=2 Tax=Phycomyces blakesleeanus TaxID=4837 RepID=A0A162ZG17_PHYB8|nr:hypothetical protein PHYBLDRAFT_175080 [Phycomyces blakesleeanus NRRL 1555(-)]OAD66531.1 hypothetical protein PHYBLDRAFT_175080 [Phycomyces blakesleeanus NRRL 1555(-)]|eukprot:XP_018284571.1 hypothetical protein PHYBLDRAFT_175080 [Phycomyces blakesleeanus NRRL 1555(-)]
MNIPVPQNQAEMPKSQDIHLDMSFSVDKARYRKPLPLPYSVQISNNNYLDNTRPSTYSTSNNSRANVMSSPISVNMAGSSISLQGSTIIFPLQTHNSTKEHQQWESYFDPQYSFDIQSKSKQMSRSTSRFYVHTTSDNIDQIPEQTRLSSSGFYQCGVAPCSRIFSAAPTPTLPSIGHLEFEEPEYRPMTSEEKKQVDRMELLNLIRQQGFKDENDIVRHPVKGFIKAEKWPKHLRDRAGKWKDEVLVSTEDLSENVAQGPSRRWSLPCRPSFLYFILGFFCPLVWAFGAVHTPTAHAGQTSVDKRADMMWKYRCRNAFILLCVILVVGLILGIILWPDNN